MEEKILNKLEEMNKNFVEKLETVEQNFNQKLEEMDQKFEKKLEEMDQKFEKKLEEMNQKFEKKLEEMDQKFEKKFEEIQEEISQIRNQQLIFEYEYGTKIDAIFDSVSLELDKNLEKSQKIRNLENRMDRTEVEIFGHEKRISKLELNQ